MPTTTKKGKRDHGRAWWFAKFKFNWPEDTPPAMHIHLLIAEEVINPILLKENKNISHFRIHRRSKRDNTGHQFQFIFFTDRETAQRVYNVFRTSNIIKGLKRNKFIEKSMYTRKPNSDPAVDPSWDQVTQLRWFDFITGVTKFWLGIVSDFKKAMEKEPPMNIKEKIAFYEAVHNQISAKWQKEYHHPLLHHLNAVFGYVPMYFASTAFQGFTAF